MQPKFLRFLKLAGVCTVLVLAAVLALTSIAAADLTDGDASTPNGQDFSHRLIVQLQSPSLAEKVSELPSSRSPDGRLDVNAATSQAYIQQLLAEQAAFIADMKLALPDAEVATYLDEYGIANNEQFQVVLNAVVVDAGLDAGAYEMKVLRGLPNVRAVYRDYKYYPQLYTSTNLINAPQAWAKLGGQDMAGKGVRVASMDGGVHKDNKMFSGTGFNYPSDYPSGGLGLTANNNGKIIVSRAYFRPWDPPAAGDQNPWPGVNGTSHGVHTAGIAIGNKITDGTYAGTNLPEFSGVAPGAWVGSYRVFYASVQGDGSFHTAEGVAALEDIVSDGMDVVNNSWGGGPSNQGAPFDAIDQALVNAAKAGVFVAMSAGNAGPNLGTGDHPSVDYINSAASTTGGTYAFGRFGVSAPEPVPANLQNWGFGVATFGPPIPLSTVLEYEYIAAANVGDGSNFEGCAAFPADTFKDKAALISRGSCSFGTKVFYAQQAGAKFVAIHNHAAGGDTVINMSFACQAPNCTADDINISSIFIGNTVGVGATNYQQANPNTAKYKIDTKAFQAGNIPDLIASFSSRGPSTRSTLKPDIAAPGVNIMSAGYTVGATGEARHLGYGQVSGTSMASPHTAGAAALLRQMYPDWGNGWIKSALMSTSKYMHVYNFDMTPAQPTDMGAGRLDVGAALYPGVILDPPSLSFGRVVSPENTARAINSMTVKVTSVSTRTETYNITTVDTSAGFLPTQTTTLDGFTVSPTSLSLAPGETKDVTVTFDPAQGQYNLNQGFVKMESVYNKAHFPVLAQVERPMAAAEVLLIDADTTVLLGNPLAAADYYADTLDNLGVTWAYWDAAAQFNNPETIPDLATLLAYKKVVLFTGDSNIPDGTFVQQTPFTDIDMDRLNQYVQAGGNVIAMGQDLSEVMGVTLNFDEFDTCSNAGASFLYRSTLGGDCVRDNIDGGPFGPALPVEGHVNAPPDFFPIYLDLGDPGSNLGDVDLTGANEVPPVNNAGKITGTGSFFYDRFYEELFYNIEIEVSETYTLTAGHIHSGAAGNNGGVLYGIFPFTESQVVTDSLIWSGSVILTDEQKQQRLDGGLYVNIHSTANGGGELRGQVPSDFVPGDGAGNQWFIDEISGNPWGSDPSADFWEINQYFPIARYPGGAILQDGTVAVGHRDGPTLERPGTAFKGRTVYAAFGLEGVNNIPGFTSREDLMDLFLDFLMEKPMATISHTAEISTSEMSMFQINFTSNITDSYLWSARMDWGDGSDFTTWYPPLGLKSAVYSHSYQDCGTYNVRAEIVSTLGNTYVASQQVTITACDGADVAVIPPSGGSFRTDDGDVSLDFPAGAVSGDTTVKVDVNNTTTQATHGLLFAGKAIEITATDSNGNPVTQFNQPFTLVVKYTDAQIKKAGITDESTLNIWFWDGDNWNSLLPCAGCTHDQANNVITARVDHLTEFSLMGAAYQIRLPTLFR